MSETSPNRKRSMKRQFFANKRKKQAHFVEAGDRGFLITSSNNFESKAAIEAVELLNDYVERKSDEEESATKSDPQKSVDESKDVSDDLLAECEDLKKAKGDSTQFGPHFKILDCGVKNCRFIKSNCDERPSFLAHRILSDLKINGRRRARFLQRLIPIDFTCKTYENDFKGIAEELAHEELSIEENADTSSKQKQQISSYAVLFKARNFTGELSKEMAYSIIGQALRDQRPDIKVDLNNPDKFILVEIINKICCLTAVSDYLLLKKYNLHEIVVNKSPKSVDNVNDE